jgi:hypothetical protein
MIEGDERHRDATKEGRGKVTCKGEWETSSSSGTTGLDDLWINPLAAGAPG